MKLKSNFITQNIGDSQMMVSTGNSEFRGIVKSNNTAAFIIDCLKKETSKQKIVDLMFQKYDAPVETIEKDVERVLDSLRSIGALEE